MLYPLLYELPLRGLPELPLTLRRFCLSTGADPISSAKSCCGRLLDRYFDFSGESKGRLSLLRMCQLLDIRIENIPFLSAKTRIYSTRETTRSKTRLDARMTLRNGKCIVRLTPYLSRERARMSVAHEIGHWLIRATDGVIDDHKLNLKTSKEEELLVEYCARQLLLHRKIDQFNDENNLAMRCVKQANAADTTIHSSVARLGDPDREGITVRAAILWKLNPNISTTEPVARRMSPQWKQCEDHFIPIMKCHILHNSVIDQVASSANPSISLESKENVSIGTLQGSFDVHAFGWGSVSKGTRVVLSVFTSKS